MLATLRTFAAKLRSFVEGRVGSAMAGSEEPVQQKLREKNRKLRKLREQVEEKDRELAALRAMLIRKDTESGDIRAENIVWIFGSGRTGSTWLASMMEDIVGHAVWREPLVGGLFGSFYAQSSEQQRRNKNFVLGSPREAWLGSIRFFVLNGAGARFPGVPDDGVLVIKEPNGSIGAPLLVEALPESRVIFLIRDPRDVAASSLDARKKGSWLYTKGRDPDGLKTANEDPDTFIRWQAQRYLQSVSSSKEAYDIHEGPKALVRYEDLRADTLGTMRRLYLTLGIPVDEGQLARVVEKHSWENIAEEEKGEGKFYRKASPGSWKGDLTPKQVEIVERITAPLLEEFYPA